MELPIDRLFSPAECAGERQESDSGSGGGRSDSHTGVEDRSGRKSREKVHKSLSEANEALKEIVGNAISWADGI